MFLIYTAFGAIWGWLCYKYVHELLPIQACILSLMRRQIQPSYNFRSITFQD